MLARQTLGHIRQRAVEVVLVCVSVMGISWKVCVAWGGGPLTLWWPHETSVTPGSLCGFCALPCVLTECVCSVNAVLLIW